MSTHRLKQEIARYSQALHERGWVANHDGNISACGELGEFLCMFSVWSKWFIQPGDMLEPCTPILDRLFPTRSTASLPGGVAFPLKGGRDLNRCRGFAGCWGDSDTAVMP